jgi:hypothetical protein
MRVTLKVHAIIVPLLLALTASADAQQRRDYMTDAEIELVREAQDIDERVEVLTRAIDRRFGALNVDVAGPPAHLKESGKWGAAPTGTAIELLEDVKKLLQKAVDDIDNVAAHPVDYATIKDRTEKQKKKDMQRFPNAVRSLAAAARRYSPVLKSLLDKATDERLKGVIIDSIEFCDQIIEAVTKLPAETKNG